MSSQVDIANQALVMLGASPIVSFDDETVEANVVKVLYAPIKSQLLRSFPWRCATRTATLAELADAPIDPTWEHSFAWPSDAIRIINVIELGYPQNPQPEWTSREKTIWTKTANVACNYIVDIDEPFMDAHVEMALAAQLAMDMNYALTASPNRDSTMTAMFNNKIQEARTTDRQESSHVNFRIDTLTRVR